jgi:hypothetical protein
MAPPRIVYSASRLNEYAQQSKNLAFLQESRKNFQVEAVAKIFVSQMVPISETTEEVSSMV